MALSKPRPGDLIEISHHGHTHWAVYVGDGYVGYDYVVHLPPSSEIAGAGACSLMSVLADKAIVKKELLPAVAGIDLYRVNNKHDDKYTPLPPSKIVQRAEALVGKEVPNWLTSDNCELFAIELRYGVYRSNQFIRKCNPGDLIEIFWIGYQHWAIYVGSGYVIHLAPPSESPGAGEEGAFSIGSSSSLLCDTAEVKRELLTDVAGGCIYRVNNSLDKQLKPRPVKEILRSANSMIGKKLKYSIGSSNCEHFVTELRYGEPRSLQVENAMAGKGGGLVEALGTAVALVNTAERKLSAKPETA